MGFYIEVPHHLNKARQLRDLHGGEIVGPITNLKFVPEGKTLVVVVSNPNFDAAAVAYNQAELDDFSNIRDLRPKVYVLMDKEKVIHLQPLVAKYLEY